MRRRLVGWENETALTYVLYRVIDTKRMVACLRWLERYLPLNLAKSSNRTLCKAHESAKITYFLLAWYWHISGLQQLLTDISGNISLIVCINCSRYRQANNLSDYAVCYLHWLGWKPKAFLLRVWTPRQRSVSMVLKQHFLSLETMPARFSRVYPHLSINFLWNNKHTKHAKPPTV